MSVKSRTTSCPLPRSVTSARHRFDAVHSAAGGVGFEEAVAVAELGVELGDVIDAAGVFPVPQPATRSRANPS